MDKHFNIKDKTLSTVNDIVAHTTAATPQNLLYRFLGYGDNDETVESTLTYTEFEQKVRNFAAYLQRLNASGERALLLYPPGLDYIVAYFSCLYAEVIAVPVYVPMSTKQLGQLKAIADNSGARFFLTISMIKEIIAGMEEFQPMFGHMELITTDNLEEDIADQYQPVDITSDTIAFLQYTSGSTSVPKGVMVSHGNLLHNLSMIHKNFDLSNEHHGVIWLPPYHDMGLIGGILGPLYTNVACTFISPLDFLQRPVRWLQAISKYRGTTSGGPNFAYDLCVKKITPEQIEKLDLSCWRVAFNGAEMIRSSTMERFTQTFLSCGFKKETFYPCYGMAEATLMISGGIPGTVPITQEFSLGGFEKNIAQTPAGTADATRLVSSGRAMDDGEIIIVDPESLKTCPAEHIGEIWISGPGVARGYFNVDDAVNEKTFQATTAEGNGPYLRTGDLGFLKDGLLFVTGRLKDMMIIMGRNIYPHDIEVTIVDAHPACRPGCGAAFAITEDGEEKAVAIQEIDKKYPGDVNVKQLARDIKARISEKHGVSLHDIVFIKHGSVAKTSSGKIRRHECKNMYIEGKLKVLSDTANTKTPEPTLPPQPQPETPTPPTTSKTASEIHGWLSKRLAKQLNIAADEIDIDAPFSDYSLSSLDAMNISGDLEDWTGKRVLPTLIYDYPTIRLLANYLAGTASEDAISPSPDTLSPHHDDIAIVGMGCKFPGGSDSPQRYWEMLINGNNAVSEIPHHRGQQFSDADSGIRYGGLIDDIDRFDAAFFSISSREAEAIDPQHRLLLETTWHALEDAGLRPATLHGSRTGVFIGIANNDYSRLYGHELLSTNRYAGIGNALSIAANRLSYILNLQGPSLSIDTACSSSLVAIHQACRSLLSGESNLALAGGVNLILSAELSAMLHQSGMLSPDGKCKAFDESADGYVRGEGCGVIVLKRLSDAVRDNDTIHSVIIGSAVNQDGRSNGITAPNGPSQEQLIAGALRSANISPAQLGYIEAHGTGTSLGDPIEVNSLINSVMRDRPKETPCFIGSVKSNIGHLEAAAGIAGLIKTVMSLKHQRIAPTLHLKKINPLISQENAPTFARKSHPFPTYGGSAYAGVSSFGFGGTNAHIVLKAWEPIDETYSDMDVPEAVISLSARSTERLTTLAASILSALEHDLNTTEPAIRLADLAYTLHTCREEMEERLAFVAADIKDVIAKLTEFCEGTADSETIFHGNIKQDKDTLEWIISGDSGRDHLENIIANNELKKIAFLWATGLSVDWRKLYSGPHRRIGLPGYPFKKTRHWISGTQYTSALHAVHPLLGTIDPIQCLEKGLVFENKVSKNNPILNDHIVMGQYVLPGVYYLEIALAALSVYRNGQPYLITKTKWLAPLEADEKKALYTTVIKEEQGTLHFEVHSRKKDADVLNATWQCTATTGDDTLETLSISGLHKRCTHTFNSERIYDTFQKIGIAYGPCFRVLETVSVGTNEAVGKMVFTANNNHLTDDMYPMSPFFADGTLQTAGILMAASMNTDQLMLPYGIEQVSILSSLTSTCYAYVRLTEHNRLDAAILDDNGQVCIKMFGVALREVKDPLKRLFYVPRWINASDVITPKKISDIAMGDQKVMIIHPPAGAALANALKMLHGDANTQVIEHNRDRQQSSALNVDDAAGLNEIAARIEHIDMLYFLGGMAAADCDADQISDLDTAQDYGVLTLFKLLKAMSAQGVMKKGVCIKVITCGLYAFLPDKTTAPLSGGLPGLLKTAAKEYSGLEAALIDTEVTVGLSTAASDAIQYVAQCIVAEPVSHDVKSIAIRDGMRYTQEIVPLTISQPETPAFKENGIYFILGGAGGIGFELCRFLAREYRANLILAGRRGSNADIEAKLDELKALGGRGFYIQTDAAQPESIREAIQAARQHFGPLNGAVHSALVLNDRLIDNMSEAEFTAALAPKVAGSVAFYQAVKEEPLDFMLFFSSAQSFLCNTGQSNYAAGCTFKDAYAAYINQQNHTRAAIINWGYWGSVGVVSSPEYNRRMQAVGLGSIRPEEGMAAIQRILGNAVDQCVVIKADPSILDLMDVNLKSSLALYPAQIPSLASIVAETSGDFTIGNAMIERFHAGFNQSKIYSEYLLLRLFHQLGIFKSSSETYTIGELEKKLRITPKYRRLFAELIDILQSAGFIRFTDDVTLSGTTVLDMSDLKETLQQLDNERHQLMDTYPETTAFIKLVDACVADYPKLLCGDLSYMAVMFPGGSPELVENIYKNNAMFDCYNQRLAQIVQSYTALRCNQGTTTPLTVLEVGAGTGGTSVFVMEALKPYADRVRYLYTDVSGAFTHYGERAYRQDYPFVEFETLDIEKEADVDLYRNKIDIVIGSNVLHATRAIGHTLRQIKRLLKKNGLLVINELTAKQHFATLTFGLTDGWWLFEDNQNRINGSPLLSPKKWQALLAAEGFINIHPFSLPPDYTDTTWQNIFIAESNGQIVVDHTRQQAAPKELPKSKPQPAVMATSQSVVPKQTVVPDQHAAFKKVEAYIKNVFSEVLKIDKNRIDVTNTFDDYGIDSLIGLEVMKRFESDFGELSSTLLFENITVNALAEYFLENHREQIETVIGVERPAIEHDSPEHIFGTYDALPKNEEATPISAPHPLSTATDITDNANAATALSVKPRRTAGDIAIIGVSGRYPMADNPDIFWENLKTGKNCIREVPAERWDWREFYDPECKQPGKCRSKWGGFIDNIDQFDTLFFNISPAEAEGIDPQERLFLESVWHLFEDAGYTRRILSAVKEPVGMFAGVMNCAYEWLGAAAIANGALTGARSTYWSIANRASYFFNLQGPSMAVDSACSSSLTAIHLACQSLKNGECGMAVAGGVNLILSPMQFVRLSYMKMLANDDKCRSFGEGGDGFVDGEGVGTILLKPLDRAIADNDHIYGIIKGSAVNCGGKTGGYMVPNPVIQGKLIQTALENANVAPESISYIETAANGSALGDSIEMTGLMRAFKNNNETETLCAIGSVKSNIGHLESAAGIAGLTKILLQMKHRQLVPSLHSDRLNPNIDFDNSPFQVQQELSEWQPPVKNENGQKTFYPLRAGISSFGAGGANAHLIIEEYQPQQRVTAVYDKPYIIPVSAKDNDHLRLKVDMLAEYLEQTADIDLCRVAYTLQTGRESMAERVAWVVNSTSDLIDALAAFNPAQNDMENIYRGTVRQDALRAEPLIDGEEGAAFIRHIISNGKFSKIAYMWVSGIEIDWDLLYNGTLPAKLSLPSAPLLGKRYWISGLQVNHLNAPKKETPQKAAPVQEAIDHTADIDMVCTPLESNTVQRSAPETTENDTIVAQNIIIELMCNILALDPEDIDIDTNIFDFGLDSVTVTQMAEAASDEYGITLQPLDVMDYQTIRELADYIIQKGLLGSSKQPSVQIPEHRQPVLPRTPVTEMPRRNKNFKTDTIFLTGATGVLGSYILRDLLLTTESTIYCLVRAGDKNKARQRLKTVLLSYGSSGRLLQRFNRRVVPVIGDISSTQLGLEDDDYDALTETIDVTIHSAALTNLYLPYQSIAPINVTGTQHMVEFALNTAQKYLLHISSYSVMGDLLFKGGVVYRETDFDCGQGFERLGYPQSKFESERIVRNATADGLNWDIVRPGNIFGDYNTGLYPFDKTGVTTFYYEFFELIIKTGLAAFGIFYFDITPVNYIARGVIHLALERETLYETYHLLNPHMKRWYELMNILVDYGYNIRFTSPDEYMELIEQNLLQYRDDGTGQMIFRLLQLPFVKRLFSTCNYADSQHTKEILEAAGIVCPKIDMKLVDTLLNTYASNGFISLPEEIKDKHKLGRS